ncbi:hypothetical protein EON68_02430, partial [archaeon]
MSSTLPAHGARDALRSLLSGGGGGGGGGTSHLQNGVPSGASRPPPARYAPHPSVSVLNTSNASYASSVSDLLSCTLTAVSTDAGVLRDMREEIGVAVASLDMQRAAFSATIQALERQLSACNMALQALRDEAVAAAEQRAKLDVRLCQVSAEAESSAAVAAHERARAEEAFKQAHGMRSKLEDAIRERDAALRRAGGADSALEAALQAVEEYAALASAAKEDARAARDAAAEAARGAVEWERASVQAARPVCSDASTQTDASGAPLPLLVVRPATDSEETPQLLPSSTSAGT